MHMRPIYAIYLRCDVGLLPGKVLLNHSNIGVHPRQDRTYSLDVFSVLARASHRCRYFSLGISVRISIYEHMCKYLRRSHVYVKDDKFTL